MSESPDHPDSLSRVRKILLTMFCLYAASYALISQHVLPSASKELLIAKLCLGICILGIYPTFAVVRANTVRPWIAWRDIDWPLAMLACASGFLLLYALQYLRIWVFHTPDVQGVLTYYGSFSFSAYPFYVVIPLLAAYVFAEEAYFRGLVYGFLKEHAGVAAAAIGAALAFAAAHLTFLAPYLIMLVALSLVATLFLEWTGTLFYGFLMHASLDLISIVYITDTAARFFPPIVPTVYALAPLVAFGLSAYAIRFMGAGTDRR